MDSWCPFRRSQLMQQFLRLRARQSCVAELNYHPTPLLKSRQDPFDTHVWIIPSIAALEQLIKNEVERCIPDASVRERVIDSAREPLRKPRNNADLIRFVFDRAALSDDLGDGHVNKAVDRRNMPFCWATTDCLRTSTIICSPQELEIPSAADHARIVLQPRSIAPARSNSSASWCKHTMRVVEVVDLRAAPQVAPGQPIVGDATKRRCN